jgi:hypothetical protein
VGLLTCVLILTDGGTSCLGSRLRATQHLPGRRLRRLRRRRWLPAGLELTADEGAGEVQTPLRTARCARQLAIGTRSSSATPRLASSLSTPTRSPSCRATASSSAPAPTGVRGSAGPKSSDLESGPLAVLMSTVFEKRLGRRERAGCPHHGVCWMKCRNRCVAHFSPHADLTRQLGSAMRPSVWPRRLPFWRAGPSGERQSRCAIGAAPGLIPAETNHCGTSRKAQFR